MVLLLTCNLNLKVQQPYLEVDAGVAYSSADSITVRYKFFADEETLRCRYQVTRADVALIEGTTATLGPGQWYEQPLALPQPVEQGRYKLRLVIQAERDGEFVDLAFLDQTRDFYIDDEAPVAPPGPGGATKFASGLMHVFLTHPELTAPQASPVNIHYTLDTTNPTVNSTVYNPETGIVQPVRDYALPLKAAAFDLAGHAGPVYEQTQLYEDLEAPEEPTASLSDEFRFNTAQNITLLQPELTDPQGSPVDLYYTLDGSDPRTSPGRMQYNGTFRLPFNASTVLFRCFAKDAAGNQSEVVGRNYKFTAVTSTDPSPLASPQDYVPIKLYGFGFVGVSGQNITMKDSGGKSIELFYNPSTFSETYLYFVADLTYASLGTATIRVVVPDAGPVVHVLPYLVTAAP